MPVPKELVLTTLLSSMEADTRQTPGLAQVIVEQMEWLRFEAERMAEMTERVVDILREVKSDVERFEDTLPSASD